MRLPNSAWYWQANTFSKTGYDKIFDIIFVSASLAENMMWEVRELYMHSDHQAVIFSIEHGSSKNMALKKTHLSRLDNEQNG